ncbi:MAG: hypothetical protein V3W14_00165 [Candidatus Neomarinimicrobiota bacterium]
MSKRKKQAQSGAREQLPIIMGAAALVLLGVLIGVTVRDKPDRAPEQAPASTVPIFSSAVLDIAEDFICSCGSCGERDLVVCTCDTANQEKTYIQNMLNQGNDRSTITTRIEALYGGRKT